MIEYIKFNEITLAIIIRNSFSTNDIKFFTPQNFSQQLGYMKRKKGYIIEPHIHNKIPREITLTQEVLILRKGKVRVDFYNDDKNYFIVHTVGPSFNANLINTEAKLRNNPCFSFSGTP